MAARQRLCECGCGKPTRPYAVTDSRLGAVKGEYARRLKGHNEKQKKWPLRKTRVCSGCRRRMPRTDRYFNRDRSKHGGLGSRCKRCHAAARDAWTKRNAAKTERYQRDYRRRNRAAIAAGVKRWRERHKERVERLIREWCRRNPRRVVLSAIQRRHRRRARLAAVRVERVDYERIYRQYRGLCGICDRPVAVTSVHWDHVVPLGAGGGTTNDNMQPAHLRCNSIKGTGTLAKARARVRQLLRAG